MTDEQTTNTENQEDNSRRKELLQRAALMGLTIHPNAKDDTIAAKIAAALRNEPDPETGKLETPTDEAAVPSAKAKELHPSKRLIRASITCNDPQKADQTGDMISVSNSQVGNIRFYFPFGKPWHIPEIVLNTIKEAKLFLHSSKRDGKEVVTREVPRYNVEILPALTQEQIKRIADKQTAALASED